MGEHCISYSCIFFILYLVLWGKLSKIQVFSLKSCFFQNFNWSNLIFDQSKSCFKNSVSLFLVRLIELGRGSQNFFKKISIDQKLDWINRNSGKNSFWEKKPDFLKSYRKALNITKKMHEYEMKCSPKTQVLNPIFQKFRF